MLQETQTVVPVFKLLVAEILVTALPQQLLTTMKFKSQMQKVEEVSPSERLFHVHRKDPAMKEVAAHGNRKEKVRP